MQALIPILISIGTKLLTQKFVTRLFLAFGDQVAKFTDNELDDTIMQDIRDTLGE